MRQVAIGLVSCLGACTFDGVPGQSGVDGGAPDAPAADTDAEVARCVELPPGAVAWWDGETLGDDIVGDFAMADTRGSPEIAPGMIGNATTIGDGEWLTISPPPPLSQLTVEAWIRRTGDDDDYQTVYGRECSTGIFGGDPRGGVFLLDHRLTVWFADDGLCNGTDLAQGDTTLPIDTWHHLAATYDGSVIRLYVDGVADSAAVQSDDFALHPGIARIGGADIGDGQNLVGQIDELTVYDRALDPSEIASIAAAGERGKCKPAAVRR